MNNNSGGISSISLLQIVFITLKLCNVITWSWLWVLSPFWIPLAILLFVMLVVGLIALVSLLLA